MRTLSSDQQAAYANETTSIARIVEIQLTNGVSYYYTDCDTDLIFNGHTYRSDIGITISSIQVQLGTTASSLTLEFALVSDAINRDIVEAGFMDFAVVLVSLVDWNNVTLDPVLIYKGLANDTTYKGSLYISVDVEPLLATDYEIAEDKFQILCRVDLGSPQCGIDIDAIKKTFTVAAVTNRQVFTTDLTDADDTWNFGMIEFTSGDNNGVSVEVGKSLASSGTITLRLLTPFPLQAGDTGTIWPGCDKVISGGCTHYNNVVNFRGEPFVIAPATTQVAGAVSAPVLVPSISTPPVPAAPTPRTYIL